MPICPFRAWVHMINTITSICLFSSLALSDRLVHSAFCILQISVSHSILFRKQSHSHKHLEGVSRTGVVASFTEAKLWSNRRRPGSFSDVAIFWMSSVNCLIAVTRARQRSPRWRCLQRARGQRVFAPSGGCLSGVLASIAAGAAFPDHANLPAASATTGALPVAAAPRLTRRIIARTLWLGLALAAVTLRVFGSLTGFMFLPLPPLSPVHPLLSLQLAAPSSSGIIDLVIFVVLVCHL
ncbi:uncharacterized protein LOC123403292 [Hordeum vulgare subsp. vulgare]|uniref:uncharacterized protein LOC123403292 n=1 Tax=Hordeum vulgare subsp. vulgare TaxID=112509 RepID=UPI001D1A4F61|nr:uncharacterized protein LOC123403292 [Hordeum vulgare subsp. vulgare]